MVIAHNLAAMYTNKQLGVSTSEKAKSLRKLSSGYKINQASDDAAGLAISEKMRRQIRGLNQGTENMQDGVSWVQIGAGAMAEINDILHRMTELSVKGANGTLSYSDREAIDKELQQLKTEINRINETTKFNDIRIFSTDNTQEDPVEFTIKSLTGIPDDLDIFNATYVTETGSVTYGGILFHNNRIPWDKIASDMVYMDGDIQKFHEGTWRYTDEQGRTLTFSANEGDTVPTITRTFNISANANGLYIDGELIGWGDIKNEEGEAANEADYLDGTWTAMYHGMTLTFEIANAFSGFPGMVRAIDNGHDSAYEYKAHAQYVGASPVQAVDADCDTSNIIVSEEAAKKIIAGGGYLLRADYDGVWLQEYDAAQNDWVDMTDSKMTWEEMGITSWEEGTDIQAAYSYPYLYNNEENGIRIDFSYTLSDITCKDSVIDGLDGMAISYVNVRTNYETELNLDTEDTNVLSATLTETTNVSFEEEYALGRDFDNPDWELGTSPLVLNDSDDTTPRPSVSLMKTPSSTQRMHRNLQSRSMTIWIAMRMQSLLKK